MKRVSFFIATRRPKKYTENYVIKRRHGGKPQYYKATLWGYGWTRNMAEATVFHSQQEVQRELQSTRMSYEYYFSLITI